MAARLESVMTVEEAIYRRRAIRSYASIPLDRATVLKLLDAAVHAPTAVHEEPWSFVVIQDRAMLRRLSDQAKSLWAKKASGQHEQALDAAARVRERPLSELLADTDFNIFYDAGTLVAICAKPLGPYVVADCWLAAENLMLMACALALGTCPIGFAIPVLNTPEVKAELGIPTEAQVVAPIIVGVPSGGAPVVGRKPPEIIAWR
jgi:nitroreductase